MKLVLLALLAIASIIIGFVAIPVIGFVGLGLLVVSAALAVSSNESDDSIELDTYLADDWYKEI